MNKDLNKNNNLSLICKGLKDKKVVLIQLKYN